MSGSLQQTSVKDGFGNLLQINNTNNGVDSTLRPVRDGKGDVSALSLSTTGARVDGSFEVVGSTILPYDSPASDGVVRPLATKINEIEVSVADFGADMTGATDSTAALDAAMVKLRSLSAAADQYLPAVTQYILRIPSGLLYAPGYKLRMDRPGMSLIGAGINTALDGVEIEMTASRCWLQGMRLTDRRGPSAGATAIRLGGPFRKECVLRELWCSHYNIFLDLDDAVDPTKLGFSVDQADLLFAEGCNYALVLNFSRGIHFSNVDFSNNIKRGILFKNKTALGSGEVKFSNVRTLRPGIEMIGSQMAPILENYFANFTASVAPADVRSFPVLSVTDNGAGKVRITTGNPVSITATSAATAADTARLVWGETGIAARQYISFINTGSGATLSQINAGGVDLIAAPVVSTGDRAAFTVAVVAAINARTATTGYTARVGRDGLWELIAPVADGAAANGRLVTLTVSGGLTWFSPRFTYVTCPGHTFAAGDDLWFLVGSANGYTGNPIRGMAEIAWADANGLGIEFTWSATGTGIVSTHNRLQPGLQEFAIRNNAALPTNPQIIATTPTTIDLEVPFTGQAAGGQATMPEWDMILNARNQTQFLSDQYFIGGNINCTLIKAAHNVSFVGTRLKTQKWVDERANPLLQSNKIVHIGPTSGQQVTPDNRPVRWGGATQGVADVGFFSETRAPGAGYFGIQVPDRPSGITNGSITRWNGLKALEDSTRVEGAGMTVELDADGVKMITPNGEGLRVRDGAAPTVNYIEARGAASGLAATIAARGETNTPLRIESSGTSQIDLSPGGFRTLQLIRQPAVNFVFIQGGASGTSPQIGVGGTDANIDLILSASSTGGIVLNQAVQFRGYTFATLPAASAYTSRTVRVSDRNNRKATSDGVNWRFEDGTIAS